MSLKNSIYPPLSTAERAVILGQDTEPPRSGKYDNFFETGLYACRQCGAPLYRSDDKFSCGCGWPAFDDEVKDAVKRVPDADGRRTEIVCACCSAHLGHFFSGEKLTPKNSRHCVNSLSLQFEPAASLLLQRILLAGGCFWGVEYWMSMIPGVLNVTSGYTDGEGEYPDYEQVCSRQGGFAECVEVIYRPGEVNVEILLRIFLEIHDPSQKDGQGPDLGLNYRSAIYFYTSEQQQTAVFLLNLLRDRGFMIATELKPALRFWSAESYHQGHYRREGTLPYCHLPVKRFGS